MKLHEIARPISGSTYEDITVGTYAYGEIEVRVEYDWESSGSDRHGDNAYYDEHHPGGYDITGVTLLQDVHEQDDDGEPTDKVVKAGTDARKLRYWEDDNEVERALAKHFEDRADDY